MYSTLYHIIVYHFILKHPSKHNYSPIRYHKTCVWICACMHVYANTRVQTHMKICKHAHRRKKTMSGVFYLVLSTFWKESLTSLKFTRQARLVGLRLPPQGGGYKSIAPHWMFWRVLVLFVYFKQILGLNFGPSCTSTVPSE